MLGHDFREVSTRVTIYAVTVLVGIVSTTALSLLLGIAVPAFAQEDKHEESAKPAQQEEKRAPEAKQEEKRAQPEKSAKQEEKPAQQQEKNGKQEEKGAQQQHKTQQGEVAGGRIPAARFQANFGREHTFRVTQSDYNNHRFSYGGYWFGFGGVWPSNWLYTQDVYVVDINGVYYLCNPMYPGVNLVLSFTL